MSTPLPLFRIFLRGPNGPGVFLSNEPLGLPEAELSLVRDENLKGIFFKYISELTFWGDGYDFLNEYRDQCEQIVCNIEYRCAETGGFEVLFEGLVPIGSEDLEWDDYNCMVTAKIENADLSNFLQRYGDNVFRINTPFCIDGQTALAPIATNLTELFTNFTGTFSGTPIKTLYFVDVFTQILSYYSNNTITFSADNLYSFLYLSQILEVEFIDPIVNGDIIVIEFTNYYGQTYVVGHEAVNGGGAADEVISLINTLHIVDTAGPPPPTDRLTFLEKASAVSTVGGYFITNFIPWSSYSISVNNGAKDATITEIQAFQYGLKNLAVTSSALIQQQDGSLTVTLNDMLTHAAQMSNMGFRLAKTSGGYEFQLRTVATLLNNTDTGVNLPQVNGIKSKTSKVFDAQGITTPKGIADNMFKPFTWDSNACYGDNIKVEGQNYSTQEFFDILNATQVQNNDLYWLFLKDGDPTEAEGFRVVNRNDQTTFALIQTSEQFHYNMPYMMALIASAYEVNFADHNLLGQIPLNPVDPFSGCGNCPDARILNTNTKILRNTYTFTYPLSYSQVRTLIDNALQFINFSDGRRLSKTGFIKEVTIPFKDFIASFEVYAD